MIELPTNPADSESPETRDETGETALDQFLAKREERQFAAAEEMLRQAIDRIPELPVVYLGPRLSPLNACHIPRTVPFVPKCRAILPRQGVQP